MIEVRSVHRWFGSVHAVRGVSFRVETGEALGLLGPNGAGKTTTIRMLAGALAPSRGQALVAGFDTLRQSMEARRSLGYLPESAPLHQEMRVEEHLRFTGVLHGVPRRKLAAAVENALERCWLSEVRKRRVGELSKGYRQRVGLACAILHEPAALILDEPTSGLDPAQIVETRALIRELARDRAVILSSHILAEVEKTCDRVVIIMQGEVRGAAAMNEPLDTARSRCVVELRAADDEQAIRAITQRPGLVVESIEPCSDTGWRRLRIRDEHGDGDARERVALACAQQGLLIRELRRDEGSLESLFMRLLEGTAEDIEEPAPPSAPEGQDDASTRTALCASAGNAQEDSEPQEGAR